VRKFIVNVTARLPIITIENSAMRFLFSALGYKVYLSYDVFSRADPSCRLPLSVASAAPGPSEVTAECGRFALGDSRYRWASWKYRYM